MIVDDEILLVDGDNQVIAWSDGGKVFLLRLLKRKKPWLNFADIDLNLVGPNGFNFAKDRSVAGQDPVFVRRLILCDLRQRFVGIANVADLHARRSKQYEGKRGIYDGCHPDVFHHHQSSTMSRWTGVQACLRRLA